MSSATTRPIGQTHLPALQTPAILLDHLRLCIVARKANPRCRWAAMASGPWSPQTCTWRKLAEGPVHVRPPLLSPMDRGRLHPAVRRLRLTQGLQAVRAAFGVGLQALLAEPAHFVPAQSAGTSTTRGGMS